MQLVERIPHESARDYALRTIKYNIVNMNFLPQSKINDQQIAMDLGISRTPVREALIELAKYGLVEMYPQKGRLIAPVSDRMIREGLEMLDAMRRGEKCESRMLSAPQLMIRQTTAQVR